jgi:ornithine carbamoyltransferase
MSKRDFLRLTDLSVAECNEVYELATDLKSEPRGERRNALDGRSVAIVLEKASTRTRASFEVGVAQLGGHPVVLSVEGSQLSRGEPIADTARVLERYCDAIVYRTSSSDRMTEMATARVPVINALTDAGHPVQVLCDVFTMEEVLAANGKEPRLRGRKVAFVGDGSGNMARSLIEAARMFDFQLHLCAPPGFRPPAYEVAKAAEMVVLHEDPRNALRDVCFVHTDVWASMGQEAEAEARRKAFHGLTVNARMLAAAPPDAWVMHCLPAHRGEEIDDATLEGPRSIVWQQAENRLHVQKALLLFLLGLA